MLQDLILLKEFPFVVLAIFVSAIGGTFQYGLGISGVTPPSVYIKDLVNQTCIQRYDVYLQQWQLSLIWSFIVSIYAIGGLLGSILAVPCVSKVGRRNCLILNNFVAIAGAVLLISSRTASSFEMLFVGRFLYGVNAGIGLSAHLLYITECAPKMLKGMVGVTIATAVTVGRFTGQLLGLRELLGTEDRWPWLLGFNAFFALLQLITLPFLPESPKFLLLNRGDRQACEKALLRLWGNKDHSTEVEEILKEKMALQNVRSRSVMELFREKSVRWQLATASITYFSLQLSGMNAVYFYSYDVFRAAGIPENQIPYASLGMGTCEMLSSVLCFLIIQKMGKKVLLLAGYATTSVIFIILTITLYFQHYAIWLSYCSMVLIFAFLFTYSAGPTGVIAPLPSLIFTQAFKASATAVCAAINWLGLFIVGMLFPVLVENLQSFCFLIFLSVCVGSGLFVYFSVPEMRNKTALEIAADFDLMHNKSRRSNVENREEQPSNVSSIYSTKF
ncbi:solute carrier family 2 member 11, like [Corythoichthys intestinalis]|uniref:solute carrier family 2 member 11, like n=1 Tax=Corythoichthys intestinalis TaxID=161448 RepID=UPI0025A5501E|nr:solute carrier family 2 member 11, like [Corythoichthys intestinalis]